MPTRSEKIITNEYYHVYNRAANNIILFPTNQDYYHALLALWFYQKKQSVSLSHYLNLDNDSQQKYQTLQQKYFSRVEIVCFSLMPNHFHLIIKESGKGNLSKFVGDFQNCLVRYFNLKTKHQGQLFNNPFKAKHLENNNALLHTSRYVIINPVISFIINMHQLSSYPFTSYPEIVGKSTFPHQISNPSVILTLFPSIERFSAYISDEVDYQRQKAVLNSLTFND